MQTEIATVSGRFAALLQEPSGGRLAHDRPLLERPEWVIAPTLGAIVPNWLIAVPREPALSFRVWKDRFGKAPQEIHRDLCRHLGMALTDIVWFEHGPGKHGSLVGCGADYAHLHFVIRPSFTFEDFARKAVSLSELAWRNSTFDNAYDALPCKASYLIAGSGDEVFFAAQVETTGSQFFRRVVGSLSGRADAWDYRQFSHADNIAETIANFHTLESAVRRGR